MQAHKHKGFMAASQYRQLANAHAGRRELGGAESFRGVPRETADYRTWKMLEGNAMKASTRNAKDFEEGRGWAHTKARLQDRVKMRTLPYRQQVRPYAEKMRAAAGPYVEKVRKVVAHTRPMRV